MKNELVEKLQNQLGELNKTLVELAKKGLVTYVELNDSDCEFWAAQISIQVFEELTSK